MNKLGDSNIVSLYREDIELPLADNTAAALKIFRAANERYREGPWPEPYNRTEHRVLQGDARDLSRLATIRTSRRNVAPLLNSQGVSVLDCTARRY